MTIGWGAKSSLGSILLLVLLTAGSAAIAQTHTGSGDQPLKLDIYQPFQGQTVNQGSGFWVDNDGALVTARHVVEGCHKIIVTGFGLSQSAEIIALSEKDDVALLRAAHTSTLPVVFSSSNQQNVGEPVLAASFDALKSLKSSGIFANGIVQQIDPRDNELELTMFAELGASGAPVLNRNGLLEGMLRSRTDTQYASNGTVTTGPHLSAVSANSIRGFLETSGIKIKVSEQPQLGNSQSLVSREATLTQGVYSWK